MDIRRVILYAALVFVSYSLWDNWQKDYPVSAVASSKAELPFDLPVLPIKPQNALIQENDVTPQASNFSPHLEDLIQIKTDVFNMEIDKQGGHIISARLLDYPQQLDEKANPFVLLKSESSENYIAKSDLVTLNGSQVNTASLQWSSDRSNYEMGLDQTELSVKLIGTDPSSGLLVTKEFLFKKGNYLVEVRYLIKNSGQQDWQGYLNTQLVWTHPKEDKSSIFHIGTYTGAAYSYPGHHLYQKLNFKEMTQSNLDLTVQSGWIAMQQHYFLTAWIPSKSSSNRFYSRAASDAYTIGSISDPIEVAANQSKSISASLYLGPESIDLLKPIAPGLDLTADYGWLWFLSLFLLSVMKFIYHWVGNWGWSIIIVTCLIKLAFFQLSAASYRSMASMRLLQPKLQAIKERYGEDKAKISQATMELYRSEKINPLGGCLPILIQIPVFIALYWVLMESVDFRQAPFILWINDLSSADSYHVLPILMGVTMLLQQKLNPPPADPIQAKVMMFLPVFFIAILWNSPSGLVLYWTINNSLSILQQWYISRRYDAGSKPISKFSLLKLTK